MKRFLLLFVLTLGAMNNTLQATEDGFGVYKTEADFENEKLTVIGVIKESPNYNVGELYIEMSNMSDQKFLVKVNCAKEHYFGFKYIDGNDYLLIDGIYARAVIIGNINLLISPRADFEVDENEHYNFKPAPNGNLSYYLAKDLGRNKSSRFEQLISDDQKLLEEYKNDNEKSKDIIQKQLKYIKIYNSSYREIKKSKTNHKQKKYKIIERLSRM
jgi:hypothetical protein